MNNNAPKTEWRTHTMACGIRRQHLYVNGEQSPFFVDTSPDAAHLTHGAPHGLFGSGMQEFTDMGGHKRRIAAVLGFGKKITLLKHRAEQMALS